MSDEHAAFQRLDFWLWCARFGRHRADCARLVQTGALRINRLPTDKPHARLRVGDVVTLPVRAEILVLRVLALPARRGPAPEARALYETLAPEPPCTRDETSAYAAPHRPAGAGGLPDNGSAR